MKQSQVHRQAATTMLDVFNIVNNADVSDSAPIMLVGAIGQQHRFQTKPSMQIPVQLPFFDAALKNILLEFIQRLSEDQMQRCYQCEAAEAKAAQEADGSPANDLHTSHTS